jgi:hypothetical protein
VDEAGATQQSVKFKLCDDWPTSDWPSGAIAIGRYEFQVGPHLPAGRYSLNVEVVGDGHPATLAHITIESLPRTFEAPKQMDNSLDARFGEEVRLLGYDLVQLDGTLELALYWQATQHPEGYYKVFVHLLDPETGAIVAQHDAVPRDWTYPTNWWETGEVVSDKITLSMADVPPGEYRLAVGMYEPEGGERLPISDNTGRPRPESHLVLPDGIAW